MFFFGKELISIHHITVKNGKRKKEKYMERGIFSQKRHSNFFLIYKIKRK